MPSKVVKEKAGRKPIADKKRPVTIYIPESVIEANGGIVEFRSKVLELIAESL